MYYHEIGLLKLNADFSLEFINLLSYTHVQLYLAKLHKNLCIDSAVPILELYPKDIVAKI